MVKGNRYTREVLLTFLGMCGVLASPEHPGYANGFVPYRDRDAPGRRYLYGRYPLWWWRASDEVDVNVLRQIFPQLF